MHGVHTVCDVASDSDVAFEHISAAMFDRMIGFHLRGTFMVTQRFYTGMTTRRWERIINFSSQLPYKGAPRMAPYGPELVARHGPHHAVWPALPSHLDVERR